MEPPAADDGAKRSSVFASIKNISRVHGGNKSNPGTNLFLDPDHNLVQVQLTDPKSVSENVAVAGEETYVQRAFDKALGDDKIFDKPVKDVTPL